MGIVTKPFSFEGKRKMGLAEQGIANLLMHVDSLIVIPNERLKTVSYTHLMPEHVLKGKYNGGTIPIGFKVDEEKFFQVDPLKAPFVVEAFQRYNDGATM